MKPATRCIAISGLLLLVACHPAPGTNSASTANPGPRDADAKTVLEFLTAYGNRDLEGMMAQLDEEAVFRGAGSVLSKAQIREFFQKSFLKHPNLRVEIGPLSQTPGTVRVSVKVETNASWADTWIFEMKSHKIHAYSFASGRH